MNCSYEYAILIVVLISFVSVRKLAFNFLKHFEDKNTDYRFLRTLDWSCQIKNYKFLKCHTSLCVGNYIHVRNLHFKAGVKNFENTSLNSYIVTNLTSPVYSQNNGVSAVIIQNKIYLYPFRWIRTPSWTMQQIR